MRVPEDVSVVGFDDQRLAAILHPPLTTVRAPNRASGPGGGAPIDQTHPHGQCRAVDVTAHRIGVSPLLRVRLIFGSGENHMKITVMGGGSTYTPELINGFLARTAQLPVTELWLMDIDPQRLEIVGGFAQRMVQAKGAPFKVVLTDNQREAVTGCGVCVHAIARGHDGSAPQRRISRDAARADRAGDHRRGRHGEGAAHHPGAAQHRQGYARSRRARRAAGELHQSVGAGDASAVAICRRCAFGGRVQCALQHEDDDDSSDWSR